MGSPEGEERNPRGEQVKARKELGAGEGRREVPPMLQGGARGSRERSPGPQASIWKLKQPRISN